MEELFRMEYPVAAADYGSAGRASADIKRRLKQLGKLDLLKCPVQLRNYATDKEV